MSILDGQLDELDEESRTAPGVDTALEGRTQELEAGLDQLQHKSSPGPAPVDPVPPTAQIAPLDTSGTQVSLGDPQEPQTAQEVESALMTTPLPQRPEVTWPEIENHDYYKSLSPEQKVFKLNAYANQSRDYLQSLEGSDAASVEKHIGGFLSAKLKGIYPDPEPLGVVDTFRTQFGKHLYDTLSGAAQSSADDIDHPSWLGGLVNAGLDKLGIGDPAVRQENIDTLKFAADEYKKQAAGYPATIGLNPNAKESKLGQAIESISEPILVGSLGLPAFVAQHRFQTYGHTYNETGDSAKAQRAANLSTAADLLFIGQAHGVVAGLGGALEKAGIGGVKAWAVKASAATAGNVTTGQLTKAAEAAANAPAGERSAAFTKAFNDLDVSDAGIQALFGVSAASHSKGVQHSEITKAAVDEFHTASAKAAEFDAAGLPESAKATREAAHAELHEKITNFDAKVASTPAEEKPMVTPESLPPTAEADKIPTPPATDVNPAVEPQSPTGTGDAAQASQSRPGAPEATKVQGPALIRKDGTILEQGKIGDTHADLMKRALGGPKEEEALEAFKNDKQHGFVDDQGGVLNREQAADLGVKAKQLPEGTKSAQSQQFQPVEEPALKSPTSAVEEREVSRPDEAPDEREHASATTDSGAKPLSPNSELAAHQQATTGALRELLTKNESQAPADLDSAVGRAYATAAKVLNERGADTAAREHIFDLVRDDLQKNVEKTGDPFKTTKASGEVVPYSAATRASTKLLQYFDLHENSKRAPQIVHGEAGEGELPTIEQTVPDQAPTPAEQAQQNERVTPVDGEHPYSAAIRGAITRHFSAFKKAVREPFASAPDATREQTDRAARVVYDQILKERTGHSLGIGEAVDLRGKPGPVNKLVADPAFRKAVQSEVVDRIQTDMRASIPKDRLASAAEPKPINKTPLEHGSDLVKRGVPLATVIDALPEPIKARVKDVQETYATDKGINAAMERIAKTLVTGEDGQLQKVLASALSKVGENSKVVVDPTLSARSSNGQYQPRSGEISISSAPASENVIRATLIHEKIHSVLASKTEAFLRGDHHLLSDSDLAGLHELESLRQQALAHESVPESIRAAAAESDLTKQQTKFSKAMSEGAGRSLYGVLSLHEMATESLTNAGFQKFLNGIKADRVASTAKGPTIWEKVKQTMRRLVLGDRPVANDSLLARAFDHSIDLLQSGSLEDQTALKVSGELNAAAPFDSTKYEAQRQEAFVSDFAAAHGFKDAESLLASDPGLYNHATELYKATGNGDRLGGAALKSFATDLETQDETTKRAKTLFAKIDAVKGFAGDAEAVVRDTMQQGGSTKEDFAKAFESAGLNPELAEAAGSMMESHFKVAAAEEASRPSPNFAGPGAASFEEHVHNRIVDGTDIYRGLSEADGKPPTREKWERNFLRQYPELAGDKAALTEAWEGAQRVAAHADKTGVPVTESEKQARTGDVPTKESPTSIKNEIVDKERQERGLPAVAEAAKKTFGQTWEEASRKIDADPQALNELVESLEKKPRPVTDVEDAMLLHRQIDLQNELDKAYAKVDVGSDADKVEARVRAAALQDQYNALGQVTKQVGTELGRGLNARKMMASEDYSLAKLMQRRKISNNSEPLTPEQETEVKEQHTKIEATKEALTDYEKKRAAALKAYKTRLKNATSDYEKRVIEADFAKKERNPLQLDPEAIKLKAAFEDAKLTYERANVRDQLAHRSTADKVRDTFLKWRRAFLLSGPTTFGKLTSAAIERMAFTPIEEGVGSVYTKLFPKLSEKAAREGGGFNSTAEAKAFTEGFTTGMKDSWQTLTTGKSDLDLAFGKGDIMPRDLTDYLGSLHGALKASTKRNEFARSLEKRFDHAIKNGVDVTDPLVQMRLGTEAYRDANRSIFMNDNRIVSMYKRALSALEGPSKETGTTPAWSKNTALVLRTLLPIVRVPTNVVAETFQYALGSVTGGVKLAKAYRAGIETLKPEEASLIMRELKKGSLGTAVMLLGFLNPQTIGGYYQPGEKRKAGDVKAASVRVFGLDVPSFLIHNPLLETLQIGATIRRVADSKLRRRDQETQGIGTGILAAALGLTSEIPFVQEMTHIGSAFQPNERGKFFGELAKGVLIPQIVQAIAKKQDENSKGETRARNPRTLLEHLKSGIPGMRQSVPLKPKKS